MCFIKGGICPSCHVAITDGPRKFASGLFVSGLNKQFLFVWTYIMHAFIVQRFSRAGPRGRAREWATLGVHPLSWLLSNNQLEEVCGTLTNDTFSSQLLLSNQDKGCTPSVAHSLPLPLPPSFCSTCQVFCGKYSALVICTVCAETIRRHNNSPATGDLQNGGYYYSVQLFHSPTFWDFQLKRENNLIPPFYHVGLVSHILILIGWQVVRVLHPCLTCFQLHSPIKMMFRIWMSQALNFGCFEPLVRICKNVYSKISNYILESVHYSGKWVYVNLLLHLMLGSIKPLYRYLLYCQWFALSLQLKYIKFCWIGYIVLNKINSNFLFLTEWPRHTI